MLSTIAELPVDVRNCYDEKDQEKFLSAYNAKDPKTPEEVALAMKEAFRACAELPSSFSFNAIASVDAIDKDREKVDVESIKKHMDEYIAYGGNINWEHRDLVTGKVWDWKPITVKGRPGVQIFGNLYGGRDIYDQVRESFAKGKNGFSLGGQAKPVGYKCDQDGCYILRDVNNIYEISVTANPANPHAQTLDFNKGAFAKSAGVTLSISQYTLHRDYTTCPIMKVKKALEGYGFMECHATPDGVELPATFEDVSAFLTGEEGYVLSKSENGVMVADRAWATERAYKESYANGWMDARGAVTPFIPKDRFKDMVSKGLVELDPDGRFRLVPWL